MTTQELLKQVIENTRKESFIKEYQAQATDEECLGIALSHYFEWGGIEILQTCRWGLEDANFHSECEVIDLLLESENSRDLARKITAQFEDEVRS